MNRRICLTAAIGAVLWFSGCGKAEFKDFAPPGATFKVQFPGTPKEHTENVAGMTLKMYILEQKSGAYCFGVIDMTVIPEGESAEQTEARLDGSRDGMLKSSQAVLTSESKITLDGKYPGRELKCDIPSKNGMMRAKLYIVGRRLYEVYVVGTKDWATSPDIPKFLDSLVLTK